jgi:hypothetical protein
MTRQSDLLDRRRYGQRQSRLYICGLQFRSPNTHTYHSVADFADRFDLVATTGRRVKNSQDQRTAIKRPLQCMRHWDFDVTQKLRCQAVHPKNRRGPREFHMLGRHAETSKQPSVPARSEMWT